MDNRKELGATFDTEASKYDKMRPGYADELFQAIFEYVKIGEVSRVVEVGSGSGQATLPVLKTGCELTSVEYGENFSKMLMEKFGGYKGFKVITGKFEDVDLEDDAYDLVFSATAFHWVPEEIGYPKVYSALKPGGAFARFANRPRNSQNDPELALEIDALYEEYYNKAYDIKSGTKKWFTEEKAFTADEYTQLLGTYSDHIAIEETIRNEFFSKIAAAINRHGGKIIISDTMDLELARK